jgi:hypothetical protein
MNAAKLTVIGTLLLGLIGYVPADAAVRPKVAPGSLHFQPELYRGIAENVGQNAIFVANQNSNLVTAYPLSGDGNIAPIATIGDPFAVISPTGIALDAVGNLNALSGSSNDVLGGTNSVTIYAACANETDIPIASISGSNTGITSATAIALDPVGNIYVANSNEDGSGNIYIYAPLGNRTGTINEAPIANIAGGDTGLTSNAAHSLFEGPPKAWLSIPLEISTLQILPPAGGACSYFLRSASKPEP